MATAPWVVCDELWERIEPLLAKKERRFRYPRRKRLCERQALQGILFVLHTGIAWTQLPQELGFGSGVSCWRRLDEWQRAAVWERLHVLLLSRLRGAGELEWSRAVVDSSQIHREQGDSETGPSPLARGRPGSKCHLLVAASGLPLAWSVSGCNRNLVEQLLSLVEAVPALVGRVGHPRSRPASVVGDRGYDCDRQRDELRKLGITPLLARRQREHGSGLGGVRWVVQGTSAHLHNLKRLLVRYERRADMHEALLALACCLICFRRLRSSM
jgi:transposase